MIPYKYRDIVALNPKFLPDLSPVANLIELTIPYLTNKQALPSRLRVLNVGHVLSNVSLPSIYDLYVDKSSSTFTIPLSVKRLHLGNMDVELNLPIYLTYLSLGRVNPFVLQQVHSLKFLLHYCSSSIVSVPFIPCHVRSLTLKNIDVDMFRSRSFSSLISLHLGDQYNRPLPILPSSLSTLTFGMSFNQPLLIPPFLKHLHLGKSFNQPIDINNHLVELIVGQFFNHPLSLPSSLIILKFNQYARYNYPLILPNGLRAIRLGCHFNLSFNIPTSLCLIDTSKNPFFAKFFNQTVPDYVFSHLLDYLYYDDNHNSIRDQLCETVYNPDRINRIIINETLDLNMSFYNYIHAIC